MRLQKALAQAGVASRRASERLIREGRVRVNGQVIIEMGVHVDPECDLIVVDGRPVTLCRSKRYIMLYKPPGYLSVLRDERGRPALGDLVPDAQGLHPAGRLDLDSEGLVLLTDDGELTHRLTHPRYEHTKEYVVLLSGVPDRRALRALRSGIQLEDGRTAPARVSILKEIPWGPAARDQCWLRIEIHEGRKRQIRRMCDAVGHPVRRLIRTRISSIELGELLRGAWRPLTGDEVAHLRREMGL